MAEPPRFDAEKLAVVGKRAPGRPPKLTADARMALLGFLCNSLSRADACKLVGVTTQTLTNAMRGDPEFKHHVHQAELTGKLGAATCVTAHAQTDPKIALEYLQRKWPDEWGKRTRVKLELPTPQTDGRAVVKELMAKLGLAGAVVEPAPAAEPVAVAPPGDPAPSG